MLSRIATRVVSRPAVVATRAFSVAAVRSQQRQQSSSSSRSGAFRFAVGLAALVSGTIAVAACEGEKKCEKKVDFAKLRADIEDILEKEGYDDGSYGPVLVRLAWHSAGTFDKAQNKWGSNGATMRFHPECAHGANAGLQVARDLLEPLKAKYPGVTYADLYTLAGGVAIEAMGGPKISWRSGRSDAPDAKSCPPDGGLPDATQGADHLRVIFGRMGFNDREIVALSGAHALGRCHTDRSGFSGPWTRAPTTMSNEFFRLLLEETWTPKVWSGPPQFENSKSGSDLMMLRTDLALVSDKQFRRYTEAYAADEQLFFHDFSNAFTKMMELGVNFDKKCGGCPNKQ